MANVLDIVINVIDRATAGLKVTEKAIDNVDKSFKKVNKSAMQFFGIGMSLLFMGMGLNRIFSGVLNSIFNMTKIAGAETTVFNMKTQELAGSWEFFKFTLMDALGNSDLFLGMINMVIDLINWFAALPEPIKLAFLAITVFGAVATSALSQFGNVLLLAISLSMALGVSLGAAFIMIAVWTGYILLVAGAVVALFLIWNTKFSFMTKMILSMVVVFGVLVFVIGIIPALIAVIIAVVIMLWSKWDGFFTFMKAALGGLIISLAVMGDWIMKALAMPLQFVIDILNSIIKLINKFGFEIPLIESKASDLLNMNLETKAVDFLANSKFFAPAVEKANEFNQDNSYIDFRGDVEKGTSGIVDVLKEIAGLIGGNGASLSPQS